MNTKKRKSKKFRRGSILGLVIVIGLCLALLGVGMLQLGFGARVNSLISASSIEAREAADAGVAHALYMMNQNFVPGGAWNDGMLPPDVNDMQVENSNTSFSYHIQPLGNNRDYEIISTGTTDRGTRIVHAITYITNLFEYGLIVTNSLVLRSDTFIDGYNSAFGLYGPGNSGAQIKIGSTSILPPQGSGGTEGIIINSGVEVVGDILVGIGGDAEEVIDDRPEGGNITGPRYNMPSPFEFEDVNMPLFGPSLGSLNDPNVTIGDFNAPTIVTYDSINIPNSGVLNIVGEVYLHVINFIRLNNSAELRVTPNSTVKVYLDGSLDAGNSNGINNMTLIPSNFILFGTGPEDVIQNWNIKNGGDFYGVYYAPNANIIIFTNGEVFGSISGKNFELKSDPGAKSGVHYDFALSQQFEYDTGFGIYRWWEEVGN